MGGRFLDELGTDPQAGYIHTMAVRRDCAGQGMGVELLDWASGYFAKAGRRKLRLDCYENNARLCRYYDEHGFRTIGHKNWNGAMLLMKERNIQGSRDGHLD